jgi:hypothetical protein
MKILTMRRLSFTEILFLNDLLSFALNLGHKLSVHQVLAGGGGGLNLSTLHGSIFNNSAKLLNILF